MAKTAKMSKRALTLTSRLFLKTAVSVFIALGYCQPGVEAAPSPSAPDLITSHLGEPLTGEEYDLSERPMILDIARCIGRNGVPANFFINADGVSPGIDLRAILLYQTGILKTPVKFLVPSKNRSQEQYPSLSVKPLPDEPLFPNQAKSGDNSSLSLTGNSSPPPLSLGRESGPENPSPIQLDFQSFQLSLLNTPHKNDLWKAPDKGSSPLVPAGGLGQREASQKSAETFRLWTVRPNGTVYTFFGDKQSLSNPSDFAGSFVVTTNGAIDSINGRTFILSKTGAMLVSARAKNIRVETALGAVVVEPGSSAFVQIDPKFGLCVRGLESINRSRIILEPAHLASKQELSLSPGEEILLGDHKLSSAELGTKSTNYQPGPDGFWARRNFSLKSFVESELLFRTNLTRISAEQKAAVTSLKERIGKGG